MPCSNPEATSVVSLRAGDADIAVRLEKDRHKTIRLKVRPDGGVVVRVPHGIGGKEVMTWLSGHAAWILERQDYFRRLRIKRPIPGYNSGDIQRFLGTNGSCYCRRAFCGHRFDSFCFACYVCDSL